MQHKMINRYTLPDIPNDVAVCPICGAGLAVEDIDECGEDGRVTEEGLHITCTTAPDIDDEAWHSWFNWHYNMPYVDWLPVKTVVYRWFDANYRCQWSGAREPIQEAPQCHWQLTDEYEEPWQGDCGILWVFTDAGTPRQHGMNFCPRCGRALVTAGQEAQ